VRFLLVDLLRCGDIKEDGWKGKTPKDMISPDHNPGYTVNNCITVINDLMERYLFFMKKIHLGKTFQNEELLVL